MAASGVVTRRTRHGDLSHAKGHAHSHTDGKSTAATTATSTATANATGHSHTIVGPSSHAATTSAAAAAAAAADGSTPTKPRRPRGRPRKPRGEASSSSSSSVSARAMRAMVRLQRDDPSPGQAAPTNQRRSARLQSGTAASLPALLSTSQQEAERRRARKAWADDQENFLRMCRSKNISTLADGNNGSDVIVAKGGVPTTALGVSPEAKSLQPKLVGIPQQQQQEEEENVSDDKENEKSVAEESMVNSKTNVEKSSKLTKKSWKAHGGAEVVDFARVFTPYVEPSNSEITALMEELQKDHVARYVCRDCVHVCTNNFPRLVPSVLRCRSLPPRKLCRGVFEVDWAGNVQVCGGCCCFASFCPYYDRMMSLMYLLAAMGPRPRVYRSSKLGDHSHTISYATRSIIV